MSSDQRTDERCKEPFAFGETVLLDVQCARAKGRHRWHRNAAGDVEWTDPAAGVLPQPPQPTCLHGMDRPHHFEIPYCCPGPGDEQPVVTHACPPLGEGLMPCCGRSPLELPGDRITSDPTLVTCRLTPGGS